MPISGSFRRSPIHPTLFPPRRIGYELVLPNLERGGTIRPLVLIVPAAVAGVRKWSERRHSDK